MMAPRMPEFERGIGQAETHAASPVRNIPITSAMREADSRRQLLANRTASAWRAKVFGLTSTSRPARSQSTHTAREMIPAQQPDVSVAQIATTEPEVCQPDTPATPAPMQEEAAAVDQIATLEPEVVHSADEPAEPLESKSYRTILDTKDESEHEADQVWLALSASDKWALIEAVR